MYFYTVVYMDDEYIEQTEKGIVSADTYGAAADRVVEYYHLDSVMSVTLEQCYDDIIPAEEVASIA